MTPGEMVWVGVVGVVGVVVVAVVAVVAVDEFDWVDKDASQFETSMPACL
jgi:hypothetical protein